MPHVLQIATVGRDHDPILIALREFPASKLVLVYIEADEDAAAELLGLVAPLKIEVERRPIRGPALTQVLALVGEIVRREGGAYDEILVNPSCGSNLLSCSLLSAAFVNGLRAIGVAEGKPMMLPVLKFSYSQVVSEPKLNIMRALQAAGGSVEGLHDLSKRTGLDKPLLSYHIRGGADTKGLEELHLVAVERAKQGRLVMTLTEMGSLQLIGDHPARGAIRKRPADVPPPLDEGA